MRRPTVIVFLGINGSGKSTMGNLLYQALKERGMSVKMVHQMAPDGPVEKWMYRWLISPLYEGVTRLLQAGRPKMRSAPVSRVTNLLRRIAATASGLLAVGQTWVRLRRTTEGVLIFDRYAYDAFMRARWWYGRSPIAERLLLRLVPTPDMTFYLEVDPNLALKRHKSQALSPVQLARQKEVYDNWILGLTWPNIRLRVHRIPGASSLEDAHLEILRRVCSYLSSASK